MDDDDNCTEDDEDEGEENAITEEILDKYKLQRSPEEGDYVLVLFCIKKQKVYYVAKILDAAKNTNEYNVSYLRLKLRYQQLFRMPDLPDLSIVEEGDIKFILISHSALSADQSIFLRALSADQSISCRALGVDQSTAHRTLGVDQSIYSQNFGC